MSVIKSFSVGNGDMFYIKHGSDNFTIIDCCISENDEKSIIKEIINESKSKNVNRFISTHPDDDHIHGLESLDDEMRFKNFYVVKNVVDKDERTSDFIRYCNLRDDSNKAFNIKKGCSRKWMNEGDDTRGSAGIDILWPDIENDKFIEALKLAEEGNSPNNISPIIKYGLEDGVNVLWMGDLEKDFLKSIEDDLDLPKTDILFAPHHGRTSGRVPESILKKIDPSIVIIGEAPSEDIEYYKNYNTLTQNSAGDIILDCIKGKVHIYVSSSSYSVDFLNDEGQNEFNYYIGTFII